MDENEKKAYLAMWNGGYGAERNPRNYERCDDGSHVHPHEKEYYEWWYVDASFDNGYHAVITYHYRNMFMNPIIPSIQVYIYCPDGKTIAKFAAIEPDDAKVNPNYCDVQMGDSRMRDHGDHYEIYMKIKGVGARLTLTNTVPSWKPGTGYNYKNEETGFAAGWVVPIPRARVEGELYLKGETIPVTGSAYHDHNWGNCYCYRLFKSWYWGRAHSPRYSVDYAQVIPLIQGMPAVTPLLIATKDEIVLSTNRLDLKLRDEVKDEKLGQMYAQKIMLEADAKGVTFHMEMNTRRILDGFKLPKVTEADHYYYRFLADYRMEIIVDGISEQTEGEIFNELMIY